MLRRAYRTLVFTMLFLLSLFCNGPPAYAWSDSGLGCAKGTKVSITPFQPGQAYYLGVWNVQVSGAKSGSGKAVFLNEKSDGSGNGFNFINASDVNTIAQELNGNPSWVASRTGPMTYTISWGSGSQQRIYLRNFAKLCGAEVTGYDQGVVYVLTTAKPDGQINPPVTLKAGQSAKISISGSSFVPNTSPYKSISWAFKVTGSQVDSGSGTLSFSKFGRGKREDCNKSYTGSAEVLRYFKSQSAY